MNLDQLPTSQLSQRPIQTTYRPVGLLGLAVIDFAIGLQRAIEYFVLADNELHQFGGRISRRGTATVHQHIAEQQAPVGGTYQHIPHMIQFGLAIPARIKNAKIDHPKLIGNRVKIDAVDHTDTFDNPVLITRILPSNTLNFSGVSLFQHHIVKNDVALNPTGEKGASFLPKQSRGQFFFFEKARYII